MTSATWSSIRSLLKKTWAVSGDVNLGKSSNSNQLVPSSVNSTDTNATTVMHRGEVLLSNTPG